VKWNLKESRKEKRQRGRGSKDFKRKTSGTIRRDGKNK
jgi:hypothetical protein